MTSACKMLVLDSALTTVLSYQHTAEKVTSHYVTEIPYQSMEPRNTKHNHDRIAENDADVHKAVAPFSVIGLQ